MPIESRTPEQRAETRALRANRTREAIIDALLELVGQGNLRPTAHEVAQAAGVSVRSVYMHYDDVETLIATAADRFLERQHERFRDDVDPALPLPDRIETFITRRCAVLEDGDPIYAAATLQEPNSPAVGRVLAQAHAALSESVERTFARELDGLPSNKRSMLAAALEVAVSAGTWRRLRRGSDTSVDDATSVVRLIVTALLDHPERGRLAASNWSHIGPVQPKVFLSASRDDHQRARSITDSLVAVGIDVATEATVGVGPSLAELLGRTIEESDALIALVSPSYMKSDWTQAELSHAFRVETPIVPVLIEPCSVDGPLAYLNAIDFTTSGTDELDRLVRAIADIRNPDAHG